MSLKPLRQTRVDDYFPRAAGQHRFRSDKPNPEHLKHPGRVPANTSEQLTTKWRTVLSLEMQGHYKTDIAKITGMTFTAISKITNDPRYIEFRDNYIKDLDHEFLEMKPLAFNALRSALRSNDENTALRASEVWFKGSSFGGYSKEPAPNTNLTAEDVARKLLEVHADNVQINVGVKIGGE